MVDLSLITLTVTNYYKHILAIPQTLGHSIIFAMLFVFFYGLTAFSKFPFYFQMPSTKHMQELRDILGSPEVVILMPLFPRIHQLSQRESVNKKTNINRIFCFDA